MTLPTYRGYAKDGKLIAVDAEAIPDYAEVIIIVTGETFNPDNNPTPDKKESETKEKPFARKYYEIEIVKEGEKL
ncbi:MAG: hypothetical protein LBS19_12040 [Clostridiales bacterium]|jgi:hypothetical protein|nr:hypothetical protein [Clostridiales bacterium]